MKTEVGKKLGMSYRQVKADRDLCLVIEAEVERIAQTCREGKISNKDCVLKGTKEEL